MMTIHYLSILCWLIHGGRSAPSAYYEGLLYTQPRKEDGYRVFRNLDTGKRYWGLVDSERMAFKIIRAWLRNKSKIHEQVVQEGVTVCKKEQFLNEINSN